MIESRIKILMLENKLTRETVAKRLEVSPETISKWCNNKTYPNAKQMYDLADLFGCKVSELYKKVEWK